MERQERVSSKDMAEVGDRPKLWLAVSVAELSVIVILVTAVVYLLTYKEKGHQLAQEVNNMNQTLQAAAENWMVCQNHTRWLAANASALRSEVTQLGEHLKQKELESELLKGQLAVLQNFNLKLEELTKQQIEIIASLRHQPKPFSGAFLNGPPFLMLPVAMVVSRSL